MLDLSVSTTAKDFKTWRNFKFYSFFLIQVFKLRS